MSKKLPNKINSSSVLFSLNGLPLSELNDDCFSVATQHREDVATSATIQRRYGHVVTRVATPKDRTITEKTSTNKVAEKAT